VLKFQAVAEKTAKDTRGLLYFAAPGRYCTYSWWTIKSVRVWFVCEDQYPRPLSTLFTSPML